MQQPAHEVSPELFWNTVSGYQQTAALKAAIELDLFTVIDNGSKTLETIAQATASADRGVRILCDALTVLGFLTKSGKDYNLTQSSAVFLSRNSRMYIGSITNFITSDHLKRGFDTATEAVRTGGTAVRGDSSVDPEAPMWVTFARSMAPMMYPHAEAISQQIGGDRERPLRVLDIAAGHGIFGVTVAKNFPNAEIHAVDWKNVLEVAKENAANFGVADRYHTIEGSAFDVDFGEGYDIVLLTNFLHHFDVETCVSILKKIKAAINDDGKLFTLEFVPNDDRVSPPHEAMFSFVMLVGTPAGDAYTFAELRTMCENSGFTRNEHIPLPPTPQHLIVSQR